MKQLRGEIADGAAAILAAALLTAGAFAIDLNLWDGKGVSPRFFPLLLAGIIALFGVCIIIRAAVSGSEEQERHADPPLALRLGRHAVRIPPPLLVAAVMAGMLALVKPLGFPLMSTLSIFALLQALRVEKRTGQNAIIAVLVSVGIFFIFYYGFRVYLPVGFGR